MKDHYRADSHVIPNHLSDPSIIGFSIKFFWDKECKEPIIIRGDNEMTFGGQPGIMPNSYLLKVGGSAKELFIENYKDLEIVEIFLKKGQQVYAQLTNIIANEYKEHLEAVWLKDVVKGWEPSPKIKDKEPIQNNLNILMVCDMLCA